MNEGTRVKTSEKIFFIALILSFILHNGIFIYLSTIKIPEVQNIKQIERFIPDRFVKIIAPELKEKGKGKGEKAPSVQEAKLEGEGTPGPGETKEEGTAGEGKSIDEAKRREMIREKVRTKGLLGIITSKGKGSGTPLADILSAGSGIIGDLDTAIRQVTGVKMARSAAEIGVERAGGGGGGGVEIGELKATEGGKVGLGGKKDVAVASTIKTEQIEAKGVLDSESIREAVMKKMSSIKYCYESQLKKNPNLQGKIVVNFTIDKNGEVSRYSIESSTLNDEEVENCILRVIRRIKFPPPQNGESVEVSYPLVFTIAS